MFEYVVLRRSESGAPISAGQIAEALLFYQRVHVVLDRSTLLHLVKQIGPSELVGLTRRADFSAVYTEEMLATMSNPVGTLQVHDFGAVRFAGDQTAGTLKSPEDRLAFDLTRAGVKPADARRFAKALLAKVPVRKLSGNHYVEGGIPAAARSDLQDGAYVLAVIRALLPLMPGGYDPGPTLKFDVVSSALGFYTFQNIDLEAINSRRAAANPPEEPLTIAFLLGKLQDARADIAMAAHYGGDFFTSADTSAVVRLRHEVLLQRTGSNAKSLTSFKEIALPDMPTLGEVIDSGERSFRDFLNLLDRASRFKDWIKSANPDLGLAREYLHSVSKQDWIQTPKLRGIRYVLTLALDATNPLAGLAAGFADNFLVEKLLGGWKPNHFIQGRLGPFVNVN